MLSGKMALLIQVKKSLITEAEFVFIQLVGKDFKLHSDSLGYNQENIVKARVFIFTLKNVIDCATTQFELIGDIANREVFAFSEFIEDFGNYDSEVFWRMNVSSAHTSNLLKKFAKKVVCTINVV